MDPSLAVALCGIAVILIMMVVWFFLYGLNKTCILEKQPVEMETNVSSTSSRRERVNASSTRSVPVITSDYVDSPPPPYNISHLHSFPVITTTMDDSSYLPSYDQAISFLYNTSTSDHTIVIDTKDEDQSIIIPQRDWQLKEDECTV